MKVLLVNGSPNKQGCTYTALSEVAKTLNEYDIETEIFWIKTKPITGCIACLKCCFLTQPRFPLNIAVCYSGLTTPMT